jgi:hypothetical protein
MTTTTATYNNSEQQQQQQGNNHAIQRQVEGERREPQSKNNASRDYDYDCHYKFRLASLLH